MPALRRKPVGKISMRPLSAGLVSAVLCCLTSTAVAAAEIEADVHLGVASCASSVCHGKLSKQDNENVWLNEFRIWSNEDRHARAYKTLLNDDSKRIARNLGLANAHTADICLDCHADNVPADKRGEKFQISDGVGCEACHGGGERWIESHTEDNVTHADNLAKGMYPTEDPALRATMCLKCHMGTEDQFTTHKIMGAGHPRLSFELEAFTANQPAHYDADDDYIERKRPIIGFNLWLSGQLSAADNYLALLQSNLLQDTGITPEFSLMDCHSCHHSMDDLRWSAQRRQQGLVPGQLRLQDHHLLMLKAVADVVDSGQGKSLNGAIAGLLRAGQTSYPAIRKNAAELQSWLDDRGAAWLARSFSSADIRAIRKTLAQYGANGELTDYAAAEQAFLGIENLSLNIGDADAQQKVLDDLFTAVESDQSYSPQKFRAASRAALARF